MGTASVEAVKVLPFPGVQKPPWRIGKWFLDRRVAAPMKEKVKKPAGKRDPLGCGKAVCHGDAGCQAWHPRPCKP
jgi:hypothetical protein